MVTIRVTDEFHTVWEVKTSSLEDASEIVRDWILLSGDTPIYEINIEFDN